MWFCVVLVMLKCMIMLIGVWFLVCVFCSSVGERLLVFVCDVLFRVRVVLSRVRSFFDLCMVLCYLFWYDFF